MKDEVEGAKIDQFCQLVGRELLVKLAIPFGIQRVAHVSNRRIALEECGHGMEILFFVLVLHKANYGAL